MRKRQKTDRQVSRLPHAPRVNNLYIIIPVHNRRKFTRGCLLSLHKQTVQNFKIVVIDDGSTDGTSEMIVNEFPQVVLLHGDGNLWWTRATNLGVQYALDHGADYLLTLNDDTTVADNFIEKMIFGAENEPHALLGAIAVDTLTNVTIYGGEIINWKFACYINLIDILRTEEQSGLHEVTHLPGRGLLIPAEVFHRIGFFDAKNFPQTTADHDFTHRAFREGYRIFCNYDAKIFVYSETMTSLQYRKKKSLKKYYNHLFGIKSGANVIKFFSYAVRNCPKHILPFFITFGLIRRVLGYPLEWIIELCRSRCVKIKEG